MDIYMIWAHDPDGGYVWLVDAMDDESTQMNDTGWREIEEAARADHGADNIRIVKAFVDLDAVQAAFDAPTTTLTIKEN